METKRIRRIGNQIRQTLGEILLHDLRDPRIAEAGVVSITHVQVSPDLRVAKVYLSSSDEAAEIRKNMVAGFRSAGRYLRGEVGRRLDLRRVPELRFELDETLQRAWNVERVLKEVGVAETDDEPSQPDEAEPSQPDDSETSQPDEALEERADTGQGNTDDPTYR